MSRLSRYRWVLAAFALLFGAFAVASIAKGEDVASVASSAIAAAVLAGAAYFLGWVEFRR